MVSLWRVAVSLLCCVALFSSTSVTMLATADRFLDYSEDSYKVAFVSGNLTAAVTLDYPRIVFHHTSDPFSPTFEVGLPRIYVYNDTNSDGLFSESEMKYVSYLDSNHVSWNVTPVRLINDSITGEYAEFHMNATLNLYIGLSNETIYIYDWAIVDFGFRISERDVSWTNSRGTYVVKGRTDMSLSFTLEILKETNSTGVVVGQNLQGGGSAFMFLLKQQGNQSNIHERMVSSRIDERVYGSNFTNPFLSTTLAEQEANFAKEDGTVMAYYRWDSVPTMTTNSVEDDTQVGCSFLTTGTGMDLNFAYAVGNATGTLFQEARIGIDETAFTAKITDWLKDNALAIALVSIALVAIISCVVIVVRYRRQLKPGDVNKRIDENKEQGQS